MFIWNRTQRIACLLSIVFVAVAAPLAAQGTSVRPAASLDTASVTPNEIAAGRAIFHGQGTCFACHGMNLEGGPVAPTLKAHDWKDAKRGDFAGIYYVVTHGVQGTLMVSHPGAINDADALRVASYVWAVSHRGVKP